ncbi:uncharacterized protein LOC116561377 [Sapajus apella]|uniref:Uncharacterized protein LOC116561377 n=1 Tax=Sapajus apella TaxID=9515 RepID=A0A6J3J3Q6_SAPAP|nr:uncharacterized protein LOC116561377 [Sapajus apella]XP_032149025.1 uncharacterized protein LOC116561377 [Sapajus apella]
MDRAPSWAAHTRLGGFGRKLERLQAPAPSRPCRTPSTAPPAGARQILTREDYGAGRSTPPIPTPGAEYCEGKKRKGGTSELRLHFSGLPAGSRATLPLTRELFAGGPLRGFSCQEARASTPLSRSLRGTPGQAETDLGPGHSTRPARGSRPRLCEVGSGPRLAGRKEPGGTLGLEAVESWAAPGWEPAARSPTRRGNLHRDWSRCFLPRRSLLVEIK